MRWCAKGYMDSRLEGGLEKRCHTLCDSSLLIILHWLAKNNKLANIADISQAFLRGELLTDPVWLQIPEAIQGMGFDSKFIKLRRCIYGLADAPLQWQKSLFKSLRVAGWRQDNQDPCLWYFPKQKPAQEQKPANGAEAPPAAETESNLVASSDEERRNQNPLMSSSIDDPLLQEAQIEGILGVHVDDTLYGGSRAAHESLEKVFEEFPPGSRTCLQPGDFDNFCGRTITCTGHGELAPSDKDDDTFSKAEGGKIFAASSSSTYIGFEVGQQSFIQGMKMISDAELQNFFQNRKRKSPLRRAIGELMWVTKCQVSFVASICILAGRVDDEATEEDYELLVSEVNELIALVKENAQDTIKILPTSSSPDVVLGLVDASLVPRLGAMVCLLNKRKEAAQAGENEKDLVYNLVTHYSAKPSRVFSSSTSAELLAIRLIISELLYFRGICVSAGLATAVQPLVICTDSNNVVRSSTNTLIRAPTERNLRADYFFISRLVQDGDLCIFHIKGAANPSDILTKEIAKCDLEMVRRFLQHNDADFQLPPEVLGMLE
ncbi:unnamed protein product [Amoebophrya sp. A120]|nr:unnamed protein product [Amoebophrya sp. A120]|eukprot:GSA120T00010237001.1